MARNWWKTMIVSRKTGEIMWEYDGDYNGGLSGGHEAHMIQKDLPGAGNILIFDNGSGSKHNKESYVLEINPITKKTTWVYDSGKDLFSKARGSISRLKNGNTLISEDGNARILEISPEKNIVWEFSGKKFGFTVDCKTQRNTLNEKYCNN